MPLPRQTLLQLLRAISPRVRNPTEYPYYQHILAPEKRGPEDYLEVQKYPQKLKSPIYLDALKRPIRQLKQSHLTIPEMAIARKQEDTRRLISFEGISVPEYVRENYDESFGTSSFGTNSHTRGKARVLELCENISGFLGEKYTLEEIMYYRLIESSKSFCYDFQGQKMTSEKLALYGQTCFDAMMARYLISFKTETSRKYSFSNPSANKEYDKTLINKMDFNFDHTKPDEDNFVNNFNRVQANLLKLITIFLKEKGLDFAHFVPNPERKLNRIKPKVFLPVASYLKRRYLLKTRLKKLESPSLYKTKQLLNYKVYKEVLEKHKSRMEAHHNTNFLFGLIGALSLKYPDEEVYDFVVEKLLKGKEGLFALSQGLDSNVYMG